MMRYVPAVPNADGAAWSEIQVEPTAAVVLLDAPDSVHAQVQADPDFSVVDINTVDLSGEPKTQAQAEQEVVERMAL